MRVADVDKLKGEIAGLKATIQTPSCDYVTGYISALSVVEGMIATLPTITLDDLRPKGRWVDRECTNCGCDALYNKGVPVPTYTEFCPTCGADMRGYMSDGQRNQEG